MTSLADIKRVLPTMRHEEVEQVRALCGAILGMGPKVRVVKPKDEAKSTVDLHDEDADIALAAIVSVSNSRGDAFTAQMIRGMKAYPAFVPKGKALVLAIRMKQKIKERAAIQALLVAAYTLLATDLEKQYNVAVSPITMLNHTHRVMATLNNHFPGYASAAMLGMLLNRRVQRVRSKT